jgi:chemotaxis family two-component system sensor kinase Cph1
VETTPAEDERQRLIECAREPIRIPGSIQDHGALVAVDRETLVVLHASENCDVVLGRRVGDVLGRPLADVLGTSWVDEQTSMLSGMTTSGNPTPAVIDGSRFDVIVHHVGELAIVEFEPSMVAPDYQSAPAVYGAIRRLTRATTDVELWALAAHELRELTLFDRVMVYHFHPDDHGEIVAEEHAEGMEPYLGLHYPASDIPAQARELYLQKVSRMIVDSSGQPSALLSVAQSQEGVVAEALDLGGAELRSVSPYHLQFMRNMGQASTLSLSLIRENRLIGMITMASRRPHRIPFLLRQGLEVLATQLALQLGSMAEIRRLTEEMRVRSIRAQLVGRLDSRRETGFHDIADALFSGEPTVLDFIPADGCVLKLGAETATIGATPPAGVVAAVAALARRHSPSGAICTEALAEHHPEIAALVPSVAGLLVVPLAGSDNYLAWFRAEVIESVDWLGDQTAGNRATPLSPRDSFASWTASVSGRSEAWAGLDAEAAELARDLAGAMVRNAEVKLAALAMHDALTGLPNRRLLMDRIDHARAARPRGLEATLLFIDLDSFKAVNDTFGHDVGDALLIHVAEQIRASTRVHDTVARLGGDEFVVLCENTTRAEATVIAERIVDAIRLPTFATGAAVSVTASVGIATADLSDSAVDLLRRADEAMYRAKGEGRDRSAR